MSVQHTTSPSVPTILLPTALPDFGKAAVLVVGDVMLDRYWFGDTSRISPEAPVPIAKIQSTDNRPGGAANVALNVAALGATVRLLGMAGEDEAATLLKTQLIEAGVEPYFYQSKNIATIIKLRVMSRHQQLLRIDFEETFAREASTEAAAAYFIEHFCAHLTASQLVILSDYNKGTLVNPEQLIALARRANIPVLVDPKGHHFERYRHATMLTPNRKEFEAIVGPCHNETELVTKGRALMQQHDIPLLLITRGEEGMTLIDGRLDGRIDGAANAVEVSHLPAYARDVCDVTGAGDTVISTLGASLAAQTTCLTAVALANLAASIAISKLGAAIVTATELEAALHQRSQPTAGIMTEAALLSAVKEARSRGKTIVFANGCFDVLHAGHILYLSLAKQLGDYVIVAVNTDDSIRALKGPNRPFNQLADRMTILNALQYVDWVIPFSDPTPERLLHLIKPDFLVKGGDYTTEQVVGAEIVESYGGKIRILGANLPTSSTALIQKMGENA